MGHSTWWLILVCYGALFYLLNKIFFLAREISRDGARREDWKVRAWTTYLLGLPGVMLLLALKGNWIATFVEAAGAPSMYLGLRDALKHRQATGLHLLHRDDVLKRTEWIAIITGLTISFVGHGFSSFKQVLEVGLSIGFLVGTRLLREYRPSGYLWYQLMHVSTAWIFWIDGIKTPEIKIFFWQQLACIPIVFVAYGINVYQRSKLIPRFLVLNLQDQ